MGLVHYWGAVVKAAIKHSLTPAQDILFIALILGGFTASWVPKVDVTGWQAATVVLGSMVLIRLLLAPYWIHREKQERIQENEKQITQLEERMRPKLKCSFSMKSAGCVVWSGLFGNLAGQQIKFDDARFFRVRVETDSVPHVRDCAGTLVRLMRDGVVLFEHESLGLNIAHSASGTKDVRNLIPEHLDVFMISRENKVSLVTPGFQYPDSIHHDTLFTGPGKYAFSVVVASPDCQSVPITIELYWTGNVDTATARTI